MSKATIRALLATVLLIFAACSDEKANSTVLETPEPQKQVQAPTPTPPPSKRVTGFYQDHTCFKPLSDQFSKFANENTAMHLYTFDGAKVSQTSQSGEVVQYKVVLPARVKNDPRRLVLEVSSNCELKKFERTFRRGEEISGL
ncbi:MAG: hypothetical protein AAF203_07975 [Pseudomonadota bacterium]